MQDIFTGALFLIGVVSFWRGITMLQDTYFAPQDPMMSAMASIILGIAILTYKGQDVLQLLKA